MYSPRCFSRHARNDVAGKRFEFISWTATRLTVVRLNVNSYVNSLVRARACQTRNAERVFTFAPKALAVRFFLPSFRYILVCSFHVAFALRTILRPFPLRQRHRDVFVNRRTGIDSRERDSDLERIFGPGLIHERGRGRLKNLDGRLIFLIEKLGSP